jgi:hypothetical protein
VYILPFNPTVTNTPFPYVIDNKEYVVIDVGFVHAIPSGLVRTVRLSVTITNISFQKAIESNCSDFSVVLVET